MFTHILIIIQAGLKSKPSDAHGHDDVAVAIAFVGERAHLAGGLFILELDADGAIGGGGEKIEHVGGIEADRNRIAFVFLLDIFFCFAVFGARRGDFDAVAADGELYSVRALIGELRDALDAFVKSEPEKTRLQPASRVFARVFPAYQTFRRDLDVAGIPHKDEIGRVVDFHAFRKTWQTLGVKYGLSQRVAQELLGHSDANLTAKAYTDVPSLEMHSEVAKMPSFLCAFVRNAQVHAQKNSKTAEIEVVIEQLKDALSWVNKARASVSVMVDSTGLEPATPSMSRKCSNQLS